mgnify:CR=1 FL=1
MINNKDFTALIAVKLNSERVPKKNIRPFASSTLLDIKIQQLKKSKIFKNILVSSESDLILNHCKKYKVKLQKRDPYFSTSEVPMSEVYVYLAKKIKTPYVAWIPVTSPLIGANIYKKAINTFKNMNHDKFDSLLSVNTIQDYLYYKRKPLNFIETPHMRSQDLEKLFAVNFGINILSKKNMIKYQTTIGKKPKFFVIPNKYAIDIDEMEDFKIAEIMYKNRNR